MAMHLNRERWALIQQVFHAVVDLPAEERSAALDEACHGDEPLKQSVLQLLANDTRGESIVDGDVDAVARVLAGDTTASNGPTFGPYRVIGQLGEGGMGLVYLAEREDVGQRVAIKVLRDVWVSPIGRTRFAAEQRALARLSHPSIAKLYDADTLTDGTPWFAMEYVEGLSLTQYCRRHSRRVEDRLRLFRDVCIAVQHAHQHLIVHRDLKPSNVLVSAAGTVTLLDFGIAKQLEGLDAPADSTRTMSRLMTPNYAAPERLVAGEVGVHSDIYSLGVILYELLAGRLPFDVTNLPPREAERVILENQPEKPSIVSRATTSGALATRSAWADLDVLCLTAMHKDPQRRYRSVEALIRDLDHWQRGEPLEARPDSVGYRARKFVGRNARSIAAATIVLVSAAALILFYTVRINRANTIALEEVARTARIQQFMLTLFDAGEADAAPSNDLRVITLVDRGVREAQSLDAEPAIQAALYQTLGSLYQRLGNYDRAETLLRSALDERRRLVGADHPDALESVIALGLLRIDQAKLDEAERLAREGVETSKRTLPPGHPVLAKATAALGKVLEEQGLYDRAIPTLEEAIRLQEASSPPPPEFSATLSELANAHFYAGHMDASETLNKRALDVDRRLHGPRHPNVASGLLNLGAIESNRERYADAVQYYRDALDIMQEWYGEKHPETASAMTILAQGLTRQGQYDEAAVLFRRALATQEEVYGHVNRRVSFVLNELGMLALRQNHLDEAEAALTNALEINRALYQNKHFRVGNSLANLGSVYLARDRFDRAEQVLREAVAVDVATLPADHVNTAIAHIKLGRVLFRTHRYAEAERELLEGYRSLKKQASPPPSWVKTASEDLVLVYDATHRPDQADVFRAELAQLNAQR
jgi:serine/threonine-protein kinase